MCTFLYVICIGIGYICVYRCVYVICISMKIYPCHVLVKCSFKPTLDEPIEVVLA